MIQRFCAFSGKEPDVNSMNAEWVSHFEDYLKKEHLISKDTRYSFLYKNAREILPRSQNHMTTILSALRAFLKWCNLQGYCKVDPFSKIRIRAAVYGTPYYLTLNEMEDLYNFDFSSRPGLQAQRDIFIFQCCIGCRVGDLVRLTSANIVDGAVEYVPRKTKDGSATIVRVPLNETASEILLKYHTIDKREPLFPFISIQKYNEAIKEMFQIAGLNRIVSILDPLTRLEVQKPLNEVASSHLARRTFIGNLYRQVQDPNLIGALSGHTEGSKAFARYHDIDEGMKRKLVALLDTKPVETPEDKSKKVPKMSRNEILN
jgi:integrase